MAGKKKILIFVLIFIVLLAIGGFVLLSRKSKPGSNELLAYMEKAYGKDFEIIEEFTYISYTDGEPDLQREIQCPAVELQDKENSEIRCFVYAYPLESGGWTYKNNYSRKILLCCIQQENLMIENEDECSSVTSFVYPCLILENTDETAQKLQNMVIQFNESYQYSDKYFHDSGSEMFEVEGSIYMKSILAGDISDRWLGETGNFCYDTPIEKYKAFLEELEQERYGNQKEELTADDLDGWIGEYTFCEYYEHDNLAPVCWVYHIDIYKENGQYYADVEVNGHMVGINVKAQVYGDEEWISLVLIEYNPNHIMGISEMENNVILSLRREEENLYTYWGILTPLCEAEGGVSVSGGRYLQRTEESDSIEQIGAADDIAQNMSDENVIDIADLSGWVGEYAYLEGSGKGEMDYGLVIYEEEGQYYGDVVINGNDNTIDVKVRVYGDEEWISLVLVGYNPGHVAGLEGMENSVLFSLRKQKKDIYTYWGEKDVVTNLIEGDTVYYDTVYYKSNQYFEKAGEETEEDSQQQAAAEEYVSTVEEIEALELPEDMLAFWLVLTGRKSFVSVEDDYQEFYWDEYCWRFGEPGTPYSVDDFMLVDMNGDGAEEVVMYCWPESTQVLYYEDGVVYNYQFAFRGMKRIHINGVYEGSNGAANTVFLRLTELNSYGYEEEILAFCDDGNYEIGGVEVSQQEFSNYALQTIESVDLAEEFTEAMLDTHLLGDLSEEERFIVEHIPVDERKTVTMNEPGKGNHKMLFWGVANSWRKFTSTDDRDYREQEFYLEDFRRFLGDSEPDYQVEQFALVDLDGDGRDEMILQCYPDAIQVLHMSDEIDYTGLGSIPVGRVVYSYQWKAGDITGIRTNGIYCRYGGSSRFAYYRVTEFNAEGYTDKLLARSFNGHYEVEGQEVTEKEFYDFIETLEEERIEFYDFTEENLRKYLLGE